MLGHLHPVFNVNLLEPYTSPSTFPSHIEGVPTPDVQLEGENTLNIQEFLDVQKVGHHFDYLVDFRNKDLSEHAWVPLLDIPTAYDEFLETFHHRHKSLPRPSDQVFKAKCCVAEIPISISPISPSTTSIDPSENHPDLFKSIHDVPLPTPLTPDHNPLALPPQVPTPPFNLDGFSYQPPPITTTQSK